MKKAIYQASNGRTYSIVRASSLDYYMYVEFTDAKGTEVLVMHDSNAKQIN